MDYDQEKADYVAQCFAMTDEELQEMENYDYEDSDDEDLG